MKKLAEHQPVKQAYRQMAPFRAMFGRKLSHDRFLSHEPGDQPLAVGASAKTQYVLILLLFNQTPGTARASCPAPTA